MFDGVAKAGSIFNWTSVPVEELGEGIRRQMIVGQNLMICRVTFPAGAVATPHRHPHEQITLVERGRARFIVGNTERVVEAGDLLVFPSEIWHGATMLDEEVVLIDIFSPIREDFLG